VKIKIFAMRHSNIFLLFATLIFASVAALHENFNFILPAGKRQCFFHEVRNDTPSHRVEAFVLSGGSLDVLLTFHGPLIESDILKVGCNFLIACSYCVCFYC
jgi:hypothetical protein